MGQCALGKSVNGLMLLVALMPALAGAQDTDLGDLRFGAAYVRARGLSPDLDVAVSAVAVAKGSEHIAHAAELPQLALLGEYDYAHQSIRGDYYTIPDVDLHDTFNKYAYGLGLTQAVYRADLFKAVDLAELNVSAAESSLDEAETKVAVTLAHDYFAVVDSLEVLRGQYAELSSTIEQQRQIESRNSSGLVKDSDVALVRAARASAEANKIDAENNVQAARLKLGLTVGGQFKRVAVLQAQTPLPRLSPADLDSWIKTALEKRAALTAARTGVQAARVGVDLAQSKRLPKVDIVGSQYYFDADGGVSGARRDEDARIGLQVTVPIYSGGAVSADIERANAQLSESQAKLGSAEMLVKTAVQSAWNSASSAYRQVSARKRAVDAATEAENSTRVDLEVGTETLADWLQAVRVRYAAERDYARERLAYLAALIELKAAAGVLHSEDMARIELLLKFPEPGWPAPPSTEGLKLPADTDFEAN